MRLHLFIGHFSAVSASCVRWLRTVTKWGGSFPTKQCVELHNSDIPPIFVRYVMQVIKTRRRGSASPPTISVGVTKRRRHVECLSRVGAMGPIVLPCCSNGWFFTPSFRLDPYCGSNCWPNDLMRFSCPFGSTRCSVEKSWRGQRTHAWTMKFVRVSRSKVIDHAGVSVVLGPIPGLFESSCLKYELRTAASSVLCTFSRLKFINHWHIGVFRSNSE